MTFDLTPYPHLLEPGCPWVPLREWGGLPNVKWCEETLCSVVAEPANTWSNLAYLAVAAFLFWFTRGSPSRVQRFWASAAFWVGTTSFAYHATVAFATQVFDFWGMYFFFCLVLLLNVVRTGAVAKHRFFVTLWACIFSLTALTVVVGKIGLPVQGIVVLLIVLTLATEVVASRSQVVDHRWLYATLAFIAVAFGFSASDASRAWCDPSSHVLQGHAIWHVLGSCSMLCAFFHYRQFDLDGLAPTGSPGPA